MLKITKEQIEILILEFKATQETRKAKQDITIFFFPPEFKKALYFMEEKRKTYCYIYRNEFTNDYEFTLNHKDFYEVFKTKKGFIIYK